MDFLKYTCSICIANWCLLGLARLSIFGEDMRLDCNSEGGEDAGVGSDNLGAAPQTARPSSKNASIEVLDETMLCQCDLRLHGCTLLSHCCIFIPEKITPVTTMLQMKI